MGERNDEAPREEPLDATERKERVLHTRVPHSLERHLKQRAQQLGMSVSTVVRHVLLNTFGLVEDIVTDTTNVALSIAGATPASPRRAGRDAATPDADDIVGWQEARLHRNAVCEQCNALLPRGCRAAIAVQERPGPRAIICRRCLDALTTPTAPNGRTKRRRRPSAG